MMQTIKNFKRKGGLMVIKVDLEKAYDQLMWDFIRKTI